MIKERSFWMYFLLSIVTCGIYGIVFFYGWHRVCRTMHRVSACKSATPAAMFCCSPSWVLLLESARWSASISWLKIRISLPLHTITITLARPACRSSNRPFIKQETGFAQNPAFFLAWQIPGQTVSWKKVWKQEAHDADSILDFFDSGSNFADLWNLHPASPPPVAKLFGWPDCLWCVFFVLYDDCQYANQCVFTAAGSCNGFIDWSAFVQANYRSHCAWTR